MSDSAGTPRDVTIAGGNGHHALRLSCGWCGSEFPAHLGTTVTRRRGGSIRVVHLCPLHDDEVDRVWFGVDEVAKRPATPGGKTS